MNCPSRTDDTDGREGWNQSPNLLAGTTRADFNGRTNATARRSLDPGIPGDDIPIAQTHVDMPPPGKGEWGRKGCLLEKKISVAYIDPGNYSTAVAAGASYEFKLLFVVLLANIIAIFLQSLCIKLGTVSGMDLAQMCREHLPWWLNIFLYVLAEAAIIATDIAEVIGTAIAINLLIPQIPLVAGCAISIVDVLLILVFYRPTGSLRGLRAFEFFVMALVLAVVICFCIQMSLIKDTAVGTVFRGYLPSKQLVESQAIYQACGILGATVMPHSLYLGSGIVQPRLYAYDKNPYHPSLPAIRSSLKYSIVELTISLLTFALFVNSAILILAGASLPGSAAEASLFDIHALLASTIAPAAGTVFALALLFSGISAGIVCTIAGQMVSEGALRWTAAPWLRRLITRSISITPSIIIAAAVGKDGLTAALNGSQVALSVALPFVSAPIIYFTCRSRYMTVRPPRPVEPQADDDSDDEAEAEALSSVTPGAEGAMGEDAKTEGAVPAITTTLPPPGGSEAKSNSAPRDPEPRDDVADMVEGAHASSLDEDAAGEGVVNYKNGWVTTVFAVLVWLFIAVMNVANLALLGLGK
ncbi:NRAMP-like transporter smf-3 [Pseudogymnoascus australis]